MTDREKLIEIIAEYQRDVFRKSARGLADHLIANGVTVKKGGWVPVSLGLMPENDGYFLVTACDKYCPEYIWNDTVVLEAEYYKGSWSWNDNGTEYDISGFVTYWMPLPPAPEDMK